MRLAAVAVLVVALAGCRSTHAGARQSGVIVLRPLPAQGLVDERRHGVALRDLRGRRLVWLPGFAVHPRAPSTQVAPEDWLSTSLYEPVLHGPHGWYRLDAARHALVPVRGGRVPLGGGATVTVKRGGAFAVERRGHVVLRGSMLSFWMPSQRLVQSGRTLLDFETGRRRKLPPGCLFAGFRGRKLVLACGLAHGAEGAAPLVLEAMAPGGARRRLAPPVAELIPQAAFLSPDRAWIAVEGFTGCAGRWTYVAPARGGLARLVYGRSARQPWAANFSELLGWTAGGRLVVRFTPPYCDEPEELQHPPRGVYLVDPRMLARTLVTRNADAMWRS